MSDPDVMTFSVSETTQVEMRTTAVMPERATASFQGVTAEVVNGDQLACGFEPDGKPYISVNGVKHYND